MLPDASLDQVSADFRHFVRQAPRWMSHAYHLGRVLGVLDELAGVGAGLVADPWQSSWVLLVSPKNALQRLVEWEAFYGKANERLGYNERELERARARKRPRLTTFRGFSDFFVPLVDQGRADVVLVSGAFRTHPLRVEDVLTQWTSLTGHPADPFDPALASFTRTALDLPVLGTHGVRALGELLRILGRAIIGCPRAPRDLARVSELRESVFGRIPRTRQIKAERMLDPVAGRAGHPLQPGWQAAELGIENPPNTVIAVTPAAPRAPAHGVVGALVDARAFQDLSAEIATRLTDTLSGKLESHAAFFLFHVPAVRSAAQRRAAVLARTAEIVARLEREHGARVIAGIGNVDDGGACLPDCARRAAIALELAMHRGVSRIVIDDIVGLTSPSPLDDTPAARLDALVDVFRTGVFTELAARRSSYEQSVLVESGANAESARIHFLGAVDAVVSAIRKHRSADEVTLLDLRRRVRAELRSAQSPPAQTAALGDVLETLAELEQRPAEVQIELKLAAAARYIDEHAGEPLHVSRVARHVHLSNNYLSTRFKEAFGTSFSAYLAKVRVERARQLLASSSLGISRVAEEAGFSSIPTFNRVFRKYGGTTPSQYRKQARAT